MAAQFDEVMPMPKAIKWILLSVVTVSLPAWLLFGAYCMWRNHCLNNPAYLITHIVQTGPEREALKTAFLAELLGLSQDKPTNLHALSCKKSQAKLLACPVFKKALVKKLWPHTLYIDYTVRHPIALVYDYQNTAIDEEGVIFPVAPFFTPKCLPQFYFGLKPYGHENVWGKQLQGPKVELALAMLQTLEEMAKEESCKTLLVDVSMAFADTLGQRQIVLIVEDQIHREEPWGLSTYLFPRMLRLSSARWQNDLKHFQQLRHQFLEKELPIAAKMASGKPFLRLSGTLIDLRVTDMAYVK